ncbi:MAG: tetratricopeptide repeat protein [Pseudonocardiaceae bacterium]
MSEWALGGEPLALVRYVRPKEVARHVKLPGGSGESRLTRLRAVYAALAEKKIGYAYAAVGAAAGMQVIRPPEQVLWAPRHATCLDLAVVLAGACLTAELHPVIVVVERSGGGVAHSVVLVRLDHDLQPRSDGLFDLDVWPQVPADLLDGLQKRIDDPGGPDGDVVAVDPVGLAVSLGTTSTWGLDVELATAVANGATYLDGDDGDAAWTWRVGVDVGNAWRRSSRDAPAVLPVSEPLRAPYRAADTAESPLRLLRAEYELVPFQNRDELTVLRDWCQQTAAGDRIGLAVVTGIGGSGKTRLALELADRLRAEGWYAGTLPKGSTGVGWLAGVVSPVLVVLDYADGRVTDAVALLAALRARRGPPAVVLLTARAVDGDWLATITESLDSDAHVFRCEHIELPDTHPNPGDVYHRTVTALTIAAVQPPALPRDIRWTTLDYVLLGWIAAQGVLTLPTTRGELYDQVLEHEQNYWSTVYRRLAGGEPDRALMRKAAACVSLVAAPETDAYRVLIAVEELADNAAERLATRRTLVTCLRPASGEGLALRPDPVGDHLLLRELGANADLLLRTLDAGGQPGLERALVTLVRAGQNDLDTATRLITTLLDADITRWPDVLAIAAAQGGAAASSLEELAARPETALPLDDLSAALPFSSLGLYQLAFIVDQRRLDAARTADGEPATLAELLLRVSARAGNAGDRGSALVSITEAADRYRELVGVNPAAFLPGLAGSLNNLACGQSETGDRVGALTSITEAVNCYRELAGANPVFLPSLAMSLNNLALRQSEAGDRVGALASITEAVDRSRELVGVNPAAFLPDLARSLNNLAGRQTEAGNRAGALASITEAVDRYRELAGTNPAAFLPDLAMSLGNLSQCQSEVGDRAGALGSVIEAVAIFRELVEVNPAAFLPDFAVSLNTLTHCQSEAGDRAGALASITEAVPIFRELASTNPAAFLPDLAMSLSNLSQCQSNAGNRAGALGSVIEAVAMRRELVGVNPAAFLPDLAVSLITLSHCQSEAGDRAGALASITEAVKHYYELAEANSAAYLPRLVTSLNALSRCQSESGDRAGALASITEAVAGIRELVGDNPAAFLPDLAMSLDNLSRCQSEIGDWVSALASSTEAVDYYRELAGTNPAAFLLNLATSLGTLSVQQSETGDRAGALASINEAVTILRELTGANPTAYLSNLAGLLGILSRCQSETGDWAGALASITKAVAIMRELAGANPTAYLPDLARSLSTLSNRQSETGDRAGALASITESVDRCRELAGVNPVAYLSDLARSLTNLSRCQSEIGDRAGAFASITEAVAIRRELAGSNPAAFLSELALSLINLTPQQSETGDWVGALASITEAVAILRELARTNPAGFLFKLALSLTNLSQCQSETGDRAGALASITETVDRYRELAGANPAAFLPDLARSLNILSDRQSEAGHAAAVAPAWHAATDAMVHPAARAELRAAWTRRLSASEHPEQAWDQLRQAAAEADLPAIGDGAPDRTSVILMSRARLAIRSLAQDLGFAPAADGLPAWASAPIPDSHVELVNAYGQAGDWPAIQAVLDEHREVLTSLEFRTTLQALASLYPANPVPDNLLQLLGEVDELGIEEVIGRRSGDHDRRALLAAWINMPTWLESLDFFREHQAALTTDDSRAILDGVDSAAARQHLAILDLTGVMPVEQVYRIVTDPAVAEEAAFAAIEAGDLPVLSAILTAAPELQARPTAWGLAVSVLLLAQNEPDRAHQLGRQVTEKATAIQRRAHTIRLRVLRSHHPDLPGLDDLIQIIDPETPAS